MRTSFRSHQRGQAMSEFVAAMALFIPLLLGIIYIGKFADIKHQVVQASRYAAMERALDPRKSENDTIIQNETVARFFRDGGAHNVGLDDQATGSTATDENPNWNQITGDPLISQYSDVTVKLGQKVTLSTPADVVAGRFSGLGAGSGVQADVEVSLANVTNFAPLANLNLKIGATTVMAGDPWNGDGAADVAGHQTQETVVARTAPFQALKAAFAPVVAFFLDSKVPTPQFGCVKPEIVPNKSGGEFGAPGATYDPRHDPSDAGDADDFCYN